MVEMGSATDVIAAVIRRGDRFLVGRRPPGKRHEGLSGSSRSALEFLLKRRG